MKTWGLIWRKEGGIRQRSSSLLFWYFSPHSLPERIELLAIYPFSHLVQLLLPSQIFFFCFVYLE